MRRWSCQEGMEAYLWGGEEKGERGMGLGREGVRLRGEEERGRVGMKRNMERRERGRDGGEMETGGWTCTGVGDMRGKWA